MIKGHPWERFTGKDKKDIYLKVGILFYIFPPPPSSPPLLGIFDLSRSELRPVHVHSINTAILHYEKDKSENNTEDFSSRDSFPTSISPDPFDLIDVNKNIFPIIRQQRRFSETMQHRYTITTINNL